MRAIRMKKEGKDGVDALLLAELKKDSRQSMKQLAKKTGMRPSTVHARMLRLQERGVIERFTIKTDDRAMKESFVAFVSLTSSKEMPAAFFANPMIKEAFGVTGEFDMLLKIKCADVAAFNEFLLSLRRDRTIVKTLSTVATVKIKEEV